MDQLRLVGVHDDGEHLVLQDASGARFLLALDQQLRGTVQRARRVAPKRNKTTSGEFGPREIQARFRAGATVDDIVEESGWEAARVKRYEWPILAERAHVAREAQKVEVVTSTARSGGYRSVFDGEPQTLAQTVNTHGADLGVAVTSLDWDAWQRPDQQWQISVRFRLSNPAVTPQDVVDQQPAAEWIFNPAGLTVTADNQWARLLTTTPEDQRSLGGSDSLFGAPRTQSPVSPAAPLAPSPNADPQVSQQNLGSEGEPHKDSNAQTGTTGSAGTPAGGNAAQDAGTNSAEAHYGQDTDELLEVLEARRGQRLGQDTESDDHLAEILGRSMGHVDRRARPISAPQDSTLFDRPAHATQGEAEASDSGQSTESETGPSKSGSSEDESEAETVDSPQEATIHHLGRADERTKPATPVVEITDDDSHAVEGASDSTQQEWRPAESSDQATVTPLRGTRLEQADQNPRDASLEDGAEGESQEASGEDAASAESTPSATPAPESGQPAVENPETNADEPAPRPRPRGRVNSKRSRSSVPSWDEIVFGAKTDD